MTNILDPKTFAPEQVRAILQGMARVAHADGDDAREITLMKQFWEAASPEAQASISIEQVRSAPFDAAQTRAALSTDALKQTFLASIFLVAYSDGKVSSAEQASVAALIDELHIDDGLVTTTQERVNDLLRQRLEQVSDLETLRNISTQF